LDENSFGSCESPRSLLTNSKGFVITTRLD
jgi:hypothetical protein